MVLVLRHHQYDYQKFFQELAQEIKETIGENCKAIAEKETKRLLKEQQEQQKSNPSPQVLAMLGNMRSQLFDIAKSTGYAAVLMLKKLDLMSEGLKRIASDQDSQKQLLAQVLEEIRSQKDLYELQLEINALQAKTAEFVDIALNFEEYMKPFMGSFQDLLTNVSKVDKELSKAMNEIQNIANLLEAQQFGSIESDRESLQIANFLATSDMKKDRLQDALDRMGNVQPQVDFDAQMMGAGKGVTISDCLANIREFLDLKLEAITEIDVPAIAINEPELNFNTYTPENSLNLDLGNGITLELVRVPAGKFMMGSNEYDNEKPIHEVQLQEFLIGKYAVTNAQWQAVMKTRGSTKYDKKFQSDFQQPVVGISWHDARTFCKSLSEQIGREIRLPTEAEWEYACRANTNTPFTFGQTITTDQVNYNGNYPYGNAPKGKYREVTVTVDSLKPNTWGIYQMHGNVWEWCLDEWHDSYASKPENLQKQGNQAWGDLSINENDNRYRLLRGGSWFNYAVYCRSAYRYRNIARNQNNYIGFRVIFSSLP
ncbi:MAG: hypothetical protein DCE90_02585 [Pseudanabaena sp.]|nr:MAG: hypothetical protein DCE90_02585 [Pseudanabaena sp.]